MINDVAIAKEKLLEFSDIDSEIIKPMSDSRVSAFVQMLNVTATAYPVQKGELESSYNEGDYVTVFQWLNIINNGLTQVYADNLVAECGKFLKVNNDMENIRFERLKVFLNYFLPNLDQFYTDVRKLLDELKIEADDGVQEESKPEVSSKEVKEQLLSVKELSAGAIKGMSDAALSEYLRTLGAFHVELRTMENGLKGSIRIKNYPFVLQWLNTIEEALEKIHAKKLAADCRSQIELNKDFHNIRHEKLKVYVDYLLSTMFMLSEDIEQLQLPKKIAETASESTPTIKANLEYEVLSKGASPDSKEILVINKMKMFMNSVKNALSDTDYKIIGVTNAESTIIYLKNEKPDLFVVDDDLPGTDSHFLIKIIRTAGQTAPIVLTTSKITKDKMAKYVEVGVADFIMKPISIGDVKKKVEKHLS